MCNMKLYQRRTFIIFQMTSELACKIRVLVYMITSAFHPRISCFKGYTISVVATSQNLGSVFFFFLFFQTFSFIHHMNRFDTSYKTQIFYKLDVLTVKLVSWHNYGVRSTKEVQFLGFSIEQLA